MSIRNGLVAIATTTALAVSATPAFAISIESEDDLVVVNNSSDEAFTIGIYRNEEGGEDHRVVKQGRFTTIDEFTRSAAIVCNTQSKGAQDFMWTDNCAQKQPIDVIKEITAYISGIVAAIGAVVSVYTTLQKLAV